MPGLAPGWQESGGKRTETTLDTVAHNGISDLSGHGKAHTGNTCHPTRTGLKNQARSDPFLLCRRNSQKIRPLFQAPEHEHLSRQTLTPPGATVRQNAPPANCGLAGAKTVATLAHKDARLKGTFHGFSPKIYNSLARCIGFCSLTVNSVDRLFLFMP